MSWHFDWFDRSSIESEGLRRGSSRWCGHSCRSCYSDVSKYGKPSTMEMFASVTGIDCSQGSCESTCSQWNAVERLGVLPLVGDLLWLCLRFLAEDEYEPSVSASVVPENG